jgi:hypothetical protein
MWGTKEVPSNLPLTNRPYWLHPFSAAQTGQASPWRHPFSALTPEEVQALPDCFAKDWVYLGHHKVERLDLASPPASLDDISAQGKAGFQFEIPIEAGPVRMIRLFPIAIMDGSPPPMNYWQVAEITLFGDNTIPQE